MFQKIKGFLAFNTIDKQAHKVYQLCLVVFLFLIFLFVAHFFVNQRSLAVRKDLQALHEIVQLHFEDWLKENTQTLSYMAQKDWVKAIAAGKPDGGAGDKFRPITNRTGADFIILDKQGQWQVDSLNGRTRLIRELWANKKLFENRISLVGSQGDQRYFIDYMPIMDNGHILGYVGEIIAPSMLLEGWDKIAEQVCGGKVFLYDQANGYVFSGQELDLRSGKLIKKLSKVAQLKKTSAVLFSIPHRPFVSLFPVDKAENVIVLGLVPRSPIIVGLLWFIGGYLLSLAILGLPLWWLQKRETKYLNQQIALIAEFMLRLGREERISPENIPDGPRWDGVLQAARGMADELHRSEHLQQDMNRKIKAFAQSLSLTTKNAERGVHLLSRIIQDVAKGAVTQEENIHDVNIDSQTMMDMVQNLGIAASTQVDALEKTAQVVKLNAEVMQELSTQAEYQAKEIQKTRDITEQISNAIHEVSREASGIADFSNQTREVAMKGQRVVGDTLDSMTAIQYLVLDAAKTVKELGESSHHIGTIIEFIDELSKQTNLLSVNAAIEAARAGEHGRGFAVVADEVRKLAERSTDATKEIALLVEKIQQDTEKVVETMQEGCNVVLKGEKLAHEARSALSNIIEVVKNTAVQIENISASAEEVTASSVEVVALTNNIADVVENNNQAIHEFKESFKEIENLTQQAKEISIKNQVTATEMAEKYENTQEKINAVQDISNRNSVLAKEANDGNQKMSFFMSKYAKHVDEINEQVKSSAPVLENDAKDDSTDSLAISLNELSEI